MTELLRFMVSYLTFLFETGKYRIVDSRSGRPAGDALVVLESPTVRLRLVLDRSQIYLDIQPNPPGPGGWYGIGVARRWKAGDRPGLDDLDESCVAFLRRELDGIEAEWSTEQGRQAGLDRLNEEREVRADELFGRPPRT